MREILFDKFEVEFKNGGVFVFGAPWCKDCKLIQPMLQELCNEYNGINFYTINVDKDEKIREIMNIRHIPTILFVKDGKEISKRLVEPQSKRDIEDIIKLMV